MPAPRPSQFPPSVQITVALPSPDGMSPGRVSHVGLSLDDPLVQVLIRATRDGREAAKALAYLADLGLRATSGTGQFAEALAKLDAALTEARNIRRYAIGND